MRTPKPRPVAKTSSVKSLAIWRKETTRRDLRGGAKSGIEPIYLHIGAVMCEMRERLRVTQAELGETIGVTRAQIANIESGKSRVMVHQLRAIASKLRIPIAEFFTESK